MFMQSHHRVITCTSKQTMDELPNLLTWGSLSTDIIVLTHVKADKPYMSRHNHQTNTNEFQFSEFWKKPNLKASRTPQNLQNPAENQTKQQQKNWKCPIYSHSLGFTRFLYVFLSEQRTYFKRFFSWMWADISFCMQFLSFSSARIWSLRSK